MSGNQGGTSELQDLGWLQETSNFHKISNDFNRLEGKQLWLRLWSSTKSSSPLFLPWRDFNDRDFQFFRKFIRLQDFMGLHNRSLSYFPLIFFKKNRTLLCIQISFTWFGCFQPLEKRTSRKNSDVVRTLTKGRKLLHVFTCVFRLKYSRSEVGEKTPWGNFWFFGRFCTSASNSI
jgi:hypothetical protein